MSELSTEERILKAAAEVFTKKGYEATKTRDIAEVANINIASLHYYFRSKEKLFDLVMEEAIKDFSKIINKILNSDLPLHKKIKSFVPGYIDFLIANPLLPIFVMSESQKNLEKIESLILEREALPVLQKQIKELIEKQEIRPISFPNFMSNLIGLTIFPFLSKPVLKSITGIDEKHFQIMLEERKSMIPDMIIGYLYFEQPNSL